MEIRFAVGPPEEYRSAVWRFWASRNDVYLAARNAVGVLKFSLHASGDWRVAFTSESKIVIPELGSRVIGHWSRPPEFRPGWTRGVSVMVPHTRSEHLFGRRIIQKPVSYLEGPRPAHCVAMTVVYKDTDEEDWSAILTEADSLIGVVNRARGPVGLIRRENPIPPAEAGFVQSVFDTTTIHFDAEPKAIEASMWSPGTTPGGDGYMWDIPLSWDNVVVHTREARSSSV